MRKRVAIKQLNEICIIVNDKIMIRSIDDESTWLSDVQLTIKETKALEKKLEKFKPKEVQPEEEIAPIEDEAEIIELKRRPYSQLEIDYLKANWSFNRNEDLAIYLNRPYYSIAKFGWKNNMRKDPSILHKRKPDELKTNQ